MTGADPEQKFVGAGRRGVLLDRSTLSEEKRTHGLTFERQNDLCKQNLGYFF